MVAAQLCEVDIGGIGEQNQDQRDLGQNVEGFMRELQRYHTEPCWPHCETEGGEQQRAGQERVVQTPTD